MVANGGRRFRPGSRNPRKYTLFHQEFEADKGYTPWDMASHWPRIEVSRSSDKQRCPKATSRATRAGRGFGRRASNKAAKDEASARRPR
jgi:hypothetical protein